MEDGVGELQSRAGEGKGFALNGLHRQVREKRILSDGGAFAKNDLLRGDVFILPKPSRSLPESEVVKVFLAVAMRRYEVGAHRRK